MKQRKTRGLWTAFVGCGAALLALPALAQDHAPDAGKQGKNNWDYTAPNGGAPKDMDKKVGVDQNPGAAIPLGLNFKDETGKSVKLGDYFGKRPVMISMLQMTCDQICSTQLQITTSALKEMQFSAGQEFDVLNISIDPKEGPLIAENVKEERIKDYGRAGAEKGWHFLTTNSNADIKALAKSLGIRYMWHNESNQYIHPNALVVATPEGKVSRYFLGFEDFKAQFLKFAVMEASKARIGTIVDRVALSCFHYDPRTGKYSFQIMAFLRFVAIAFVSGSLLAIWAMVRLEKRRGQTKTGSPQLKKA